jgi:hypothetical protein
MGARAAIDGRPVHEPGAIDFVGLDGNPLDLFRSFRLTDPPEEIGHFLSQAGFLHLRGVFTVEEMAAVSAELDAALSKATPDDGNSWWARTKFGEHYASRILGFNEQSPTLRSLLSDSRFAAVGGFTDDLFIQRDPVVPGSAEGLYKKIGVVEGISDVSWHKDCSLGGHSRSCCGLTVGISITAADEESGELGVVAGSHRANVSGHGVRSDLDLPRLPLPTGVGDLTVHCSCTLHMSRPPVRRERCVVYSGFSLSPRDRDVMHRVDPVDARRARAALSDQGHRLLERSDTPDAGFLFALDARSADPS